MEKQLLFSVHVFNAGINIHSWQVPFWCPISWCLSFWGFLCSTWSWLWVSTPGEDLSMPWLWYAHCLKVLNGISKASTKSAVSIWTKETKSDLLITVPCAARSGHGICGYLLYHVHLLQPGHHLGPLLPLQLLPGSVTLAALQQHLEYSKLHQPCHQQQLLLHSQPGVLQVGLAMWGKPDQFVGVRKTWTWLHLCFIQWSQFESNLGSIKSRC